MNNSQQLLPTTGNQMGSRGLSSMSMGIQRQTRRELEHVQARGAVAKLVEDGRAMLTHTALEHIGALTALEQHLITVAPLGEARYREIVDGYTLGASAAIRRWQ